MSLHDASPLENFHQFIGEQLRSDRTAGLSPEQALALWRERQATTEAIREGLSDLEAGRFKPLDDFLRDFEARHGTAGHG